MHHSTRGTFFKHSAKTFQQDLLLTDHRVCLAHVILPRFWGVPIRRLLWWSICEHMHVLCTLRGDINDSSYSARSSNDMLSDQLRLSRSAHCLHWWEVCLWSWGEATPPWECARWSCMLRSLRLHEGSNGRIWISKCTVGSVFDFTSTFQHEPDSGKPLNTQRLV